jgi:hypothetical protein
MATYTTVYLIGEPILAGYGFQLQYLLQIVVEMLQGIG